MGIFKSQMGHATHVYLLVSFAMELKGQISNFINVNQNGVYHLKCELRNLMVPFILLFDI